MKNTMIHGIARRLAGGLLPLLAAALPACQVDRLPEKCSCTVNVGKEFFVPEEGGTYPIVVSSDRDWTMEALDAATADWCSFDVAAGPGGSTTVYVTVETNPEEADARLARFLFAAGADGMVMTLVQKGMPRLTTSPVGASNIDEDLALLPGSFAYSNPKEALRLGFYYREADAGREWSYVPYTGELRSGNYSVRLTGLRPATVYEYRAYLLTDREYFGDIERFTTYPEARLATVDKVRELMENGSAVSEGLKIEAVVVSDSLAGNIIRPASGAVYHVVEKTNPTGRDMGLTICVTDGESCYNRGDLLEIKLTGAPFGRVSVRESDLTVRTVEVASVKLSKVGVQEVVPVEITPDELPNHLSQLVTIRNTQLTAPYAAEDQYPVWAGDKHMECAGYDLPFLLAVVPEAAFAAEIPQRGSGSVTGVAFESSLPALCGVMPSAAGDLELTGERFDSTLSLRAVSLGNGGGVIAGEALENYVLTVTYINGVRGQVLPMPISATVEGDSGLAAGVLENCVLPFDGMGTIEIPLTGTPADVDCIVATVTGLEAYGLSGDAARVTIPVVVPPAEGNFAAQWVLAPSDVKSGANGTSYGTPRDLGPLDLDAAASSLNSVSVGAFLMTGFYNGGNWSNGWGGAILEGNSPANPLTYCTTTISVPEGKTLSLHKYTMRVRGNTTSEKITYLQYSIDGGAFRTVGSTTLAAANSYKVFTYMLFTNPELTHIPGGSTVVLRVLPQAVPDAPNAAWVFDGRGNAPVLTGNVE